MRVFACVALVVAVGCGSDPVRHVADAGPPDSPRLADAGPDAAAQPVTLTITDRGTPIVGVPVYFQNVDSSLVSATMTDTNGVASVVIAPGGFVTAINPFFPPIAFGSPPPILETFAGVKPGDHLVLRQDSSVGITITVIAPADVNPSAVGYKLYASCADSAFGDTIPPPANGSASTTTGTVTLYDCQGTADLLLVTTDTDGLAVRYIYKPATAVTDGMTLDLTAATYVSALPRDYTWNNVADSTDNIGVRDYLASPKGLLFGFALNVSGNPATTQAPMPGFTGALDIVESFQQPSITSVRDVFEWGAYSPTYTTDFGAHLVPDFATFATFDKATHSGVWTEVNGAVQPDFVTAGLYVSRLSPSLVWRWRVVAPYAAGRFALPVLPVPQDLYNIAGDDSVTFEQLDMAKVPGGYDAVRAGIFASNSPLDVIAGASGVISISDQPQVVTLQAPARRKLVRPRMNRR
ncbi:MAG: hypothetical protein JWO36_567 [Myxococcales bacterium]|nr:hypothetical protein [Myxococcales bacterium]